MKQLSTAFSLLLLLLTHSSQAQSWTQQYPNHSLKDLYDVSFNNLGNGLAVGEGNAFLTTSDWGDTWTEQVFPFSGTLFYKVRFAPDPGSQVAYVLEHTKLFKTTDAGATWVQVPLQVGTVGSTKAIEVISENEVFIVGPLNMLHTVNGGTTWSLIEYPNITSAIKSFQFLTPQLGWIGTITGDIFGTTNGGATWTPLDTTQFNKAVALRFYDANIGYAGIDRALAKTTDGGQTWNVLADPVFSTGVNSIAFVNATNVIFTSGNRAYYTKDGGTVNYLVQPLQYSSANKGVFALPDGRVWVAADFHSIAVSYDGGEGYEEQIPGNKNFLQYIGFVDENHGWATGFNYAILKTSNGGDTWDDISPTPTPTSMWIVRGGMAVSANEFWVCGNTFITKTTDGGVSWNTISQGGGSVNCLEATSNAVYSAHTNGRVYKTTNGGGNWTNSEVQAQATLVSLSFPTDNVGYVAGWNGLVAKTTDAGASWTVLNFPTTDNIGEVHFLDENTGWIGVDKFSSVIYKTTDGGQSWTTITVPATAYWYNILFKDAQNGIVSGGSSGVGRVFRTSDGGETWITVYLDERIGRGLSLVSTTNEDLLWICGDGGSISHTSLPLVSSVFEVTETENLALSPNPASGIVSLPNADQFSREAVLDMMDVQGRIVKHLTGISATISLESLQSGIYLVRISDGAKIYTGKLAVD